MINKKRTIAFTAVAVLAGILNLSTKNAYSELNFSDCNSQYNKGIESTLSEEENLPRIIINPGHDSTYTGFWINNFREEDLNLELSKRLDTLLSDRGYKVFLVRDSPAPINIDSLNLNDDTIFNWKDELMARANYIKNNKSDCAIIIHHNAYPESNRVSGTEIYFYGLLSSKQLNDKNINFNRPEDCTIYSKSSKDVALKISEYLKSREMKSVVYGSDMRELIENPFKTVIYIEARYLTNPSDLEKATTEKGQMEMAEALADFFGEHKDYLQSLKQDSSNVIIPNSLSSK